ncbi:DMT family transporter [Halalkalibacter lacteus]|uniref:DMT family transporter n=1 Tax=Halalkalibacter lacteus TaxID=3090663 RepID=UPI002FCBAA36
MIFLRFQFEPIDFVLLGAVSTWALYSVIGRVVLRKFSSIVSTTYAVGFGTFFLLPFLLLESPWENIATSTLSAWLAIAHMSVFVTVIGFILYYYGIQKIGAAKASIFINVMPVSAVIMATLFLGETLTFATVIGALFVLSGVYVGTSVRHRKDKRFSHAKTG